MKSYYYTSVYEASVICYIVALLCPGRKYGMLEPAGERIGIYTPPAEQP